MNNVLVRMDAAGMSVKADVVEARLAYLFGGSNECTQEVPHCSSGWRDAHRRSQRGQIFDTHWRQRFSMSSEPNISPVHTPRVVGCVETPERLP